MYSCIKISGVGYEWHRWVKVLRLKACHALEAGKHFPALCGCAGGAMHCGGDCACSCIVLQSGCAELVAKSGVVILQRQVGPSHAHNWSTTEHLVAQYSAAANTSSTISLKFAAMPFTP